jgi:CDP-diglyceride synthetase
LSQSFLVDLAATPGCRNYGSNQEKSMSIFEVIMLLCFGFAWPLSLAKSWRSRTTRGKSILFLLVIFTGYLCGILHKVFYSPDGVIYLYILNSIMVGADIGLFFRNRSWEKHHRREIWG